MSGRTQELRALLAAAQEQGRLVITGHDCADVDSVASCALMQRLLSVWGIPAQIVLNTRADGQARRVMPRFGVEPDSLTGEIRPEDGLILVDHHQASCPGRMLAIVDHHPTDYPPSCPFVLIEPAGACAAMVLRLMQEAGVPVSAQDERLAVTALYLDTIALRSAKIPPAEADWGRAQAARLGLDEAWLCREGMGLRDMRLPARELALLGRKVYDFGGRRVLSTYVQTDAMTQEKLGEILAVLREETLRERAALWVFLVHDPIAMRSTQYNITPDGQVRTLPYPFLASRGKDVMPQVEREMRKAGEADGGIAAGADAGA